MNAISKCGIGMRISALSVNRTGMGLFYRACRPEHNGTCLSFHLPNWWNGPLFVVHQDKMLDRVNTFSTTSSWCTAMQLFLQWTVQHSVIQLGWVAEMRCRNHQASWQEFDWGYPLRSLAHKTTSHFASSQHSRGAYWSRCPHSWWRNPCFWYRRVRHQPCWPPAGIHHSWYNIYCPDCPRWRSHNMPFWCLQNMSDRRADRRLCRGLLLSGAKTPVQAWKHTIGKVEEFMHTTTSNFTLNQDQDW